MTEDEQDKLAEQVLLSAWDKFAAESRDAFKAELHDKISVRDLLDDNNKPKDIEYLIVRYLVRWCFDIIGDRGREHVDKQFLYLYYHICGRHSATDMILENRELIELMRKLDLQIFPRKGMGK